MNLRQRFTDWNLELRIADHCWLSKACDAAGLKAGTRHHFAEMTKLVLQRSPQQVERMERAKGLCRAKN